MIWIFYRILKVEKNIIIKMSSQLLIKNNVHQ